MKDGILEINAESRDMDGMGPTLLKHSQLEGSRGAAWWANLTLRA